MVFARYHGEPRTAERAEAAAGIMPGQGSPFDYMFPDLARDPDSVLPLGATTISGLRALGSSIANEEPQNAPLDGIGIPAAYTYFGQFIDHDITKSNFVPQIAGGLDLIQAHSFAPIAPDDLPTLVENGRTAVLDLDSLYGGLAAQATAPDGSMVLGEVTNVGPIATDDPFHDLPRRPRIENPATLDQVAQDREALIGDPRNDENLLVAQLHVAFLRAHNALQRRLGNAGDAETALRRRYQAAVVHDFLPRICGTAVHDRLRADGARFLDMSNGLFMPVEFAGAAYRFGHSMVRQSYEHNEVFNSQAGNPATFNFLFTFTALSGDVNFEEGAGGFDTLPSNWIIEWHRFFSTDPNDPDQGSENPARPIDTHLAMELGELPSPFGEAQIGHLMSRLASRNLLRGYLLSLPSGQAIAARMGAAPLSPDEIRGLVAEEAHAACEAAGLFERTPLWFYVLAEAEVRHQGRHLGEVGGTIVGETLWEMVRHSPDSVLADPPTDEELASGEFSLRGIVKLGQDSGLPPL
jgi:hypothetical protein